MFWRTEDDSKSNLNLSDDNFETSHRCSSSDESSEREVISKAGISIASTG